MGIDRVCALIIIVCVFIIRSHPRHGHILQKKITQETNHHIVLELGERNSDKQENSMYILQIFTKKQSLKNVSFLNRLRKVNNPLGNI